MSERRTSSPRSEVRARVGDEVVVAARRGASTERRGTVEQVQGPEGAPPYVVRWWDDGCIGLVFPGTDISIGTRHRRHQMKEAS